MKNDNHGWTTTLPNKPGLYWQTVCTSIGSWHTELVCVSVETRLDGTKVIRLTDVTPSFVGKPPKAPKTETRIWQEHNNHSQQFFQGPVELPAQPDKKTLQALANVPAEPGLYYNSHNGSDGSGWHSEVVSVTILRAHGFADQLWQIELPDCRLQDAGPVQNACYGSVFPVAPPKKLPYGDELVMPVTERRR